MPTEIEAKFRVDDPGRLDRLAADPMLGPAALGRARSVEEVDAYLDTGERALERAGWACRLRSRGAVVTVSLKGTADGPSSGGIHRRPEVEGPATASREPRDWPPSPARDLVDELRRGDQLVELLTLRQRRTERGVTVGETTLGILSLDAVTVHVGEVEHGTFHAVELELATEAADGEGALAQLAAVLAAHDGLVPDRLTKLERARELIGVR